MKILHVANYSVRMKGYIARVNRNFEKENHIFYIVGFSHGNGDTIVGDNVIYERELGDKWQARLQELIDGADRIILHSMDSKNLLKQKMYLKALDDNKEIVWAIWGHDVYDAYWRAHNIGLIKHPKQFLRTQKEESIRRKLINKVQYIMGIPGDYESVKRWYSTNAKYIFFNQVSYGEESILELEPVKNDATKIVVGHDAYPHCRHKESLDILKRMDDNKMQIYCPLPYSGDEPVLVKEVKEYGSRLFGDRFYAITNQVNYTDYCKFVNSMDVAFYNHNRQMAEGNVLMFLYYGKKVFVSKENCIGDFFKGLGSVIFSADELNSDSLFTPLSSEDKQKNKDVITYNLGDEAFINTWKEAFGITR